MTFTVTASSHEEAIRIVEDGMPEELEPHFDDVNEVRVITS